MAGLLQTAHRVIDVKLSSLRFTEPYAAFLVSVCNVQWRGDVFRSSESWSTPPFTATVAPSKRAQSYASRCCTCHLGAVMLVRILHRTGRVGVANFNAARKYSQLEPRDHRS